MGFGGRQIALVVEVLNLDVVPRDVPFQDVARTERCVRYDPEAHGSAEQRSQSAFQIVERSPRRGDSESERHLLERRNIAG